MKTTVELPDELFRRAKALAATQGVSLKTLLTEAVAERLRRDGARATEPAWRELAGALAPLRKETRRINELIEDEFGHVEEDDS